MSIAAQMLERMPLGPGHRRMFWILAAGMMIDAFDLLMQSSVVAAMVNSKFTDRSGLPEFVLATSLGLALGSLLSGALSDHIGRRSLYQFNLVLFAVCALLIAVSPSFQLVVGLRFVMGIGLGGELVNGYAIMSEMTPAAQRGRWGLILGLLVNLAQPVSAGISAVVIPAVGWRWMFVLGGVPAFAVWYLRRSLPESPRWLERKGRLAEMHEVLRGVWRENAGDAPMPQITARAAMDERKLPWTELFAARRLGRTLFCFAMIALTLGCQYGFLSWVPTLLLQHNQSIVRSLYYNTIILLGAPLGIITAVVLVERVGRRLLVVIGGIAMGVMSVAYAYALDAPAWVLLVAGFFNVFAIQIAATTVIGTYLAELFPTDIRGTGFGASMAVGRVAAGAMPYLVLYVLNVATVFSVFAMLGGFALLLALLTFLAGPETKRKSLEEIENDYLAARGG